MSSSGYTTPERRETVTRPLPNPNAPMVVRRENRRSINDGTTRGISEEESTAFAQALERRFAIVAPLITPPRSTGSGSPAGGSPGSIAFPDLSDLPNVPEVGFTTPTRQSPQPRSRSPPPAPRRGVVRLHSEAFGGEEEESGGESDFEEFDYLNTPPLRKRPRNSPPGGE